MDIYIDENVSLKRVFDENATKLVWGGTFYFIPFWFEENEVGYKMHHISSMPTQLREAILRFRGEEQNDPAYTKKDLEDAFINGRRFDTFTHYMQLKDK